MNNGTSPKISVIVPVYNTEKYIRKSLESITSQTLKDIEIICVDDGSTDNSLNIIQEFAQNDQRFIILTQKNLYAGVARNNGLKIAKGKYCIFLDADDYFYSTMLEKLYDRAEETQADLTMCRFDIILQDGTVQKNLGFQTIPKKIFNKNHIENPFHFSSVVPWNKLYLRSFIQKNNLCFTSTKISNDISFTIKTFFLAERITQVEMTLLEYLYTNPSSVTSKRGCFIDVVPISTEEIYLFLEQNKLLNQYEEQYKKWIFCNYLYNLGFPSNSEVLKRMKEGLEKTKHYPLIKDILIKQALTRDVILGENISQIVDLPLKIKIKKKIKKANPFKKTKSSDGRRHLYFCDIELFSYTHKKT